MKSILAGALASLAALAVLSACSKDDKVTTPTTTPGVELPDGIAIPEEVTIPGAPISGVPISSDESIPSDSSIPPETIDLMIAQFEAAGMKVDKACFAALLSDDDMRQLIAAGSSGIPTPDLTKKFFACVTA
jgi:hypothetical protein